MYFQPELADLHGHSIPFWLSTDVILVFLGAYFSDEYVYPHLLVPESDPYPI